MSDTSFRRAARWSLRGAALMGGLFLAVGALQIVMTGSFRPGHVGPLLAVTAIGATVGGLAGPLLGSALERRRSGGAPGGSAGPEEDDGEGSGRDGP